MVTKKSAAATDWARMHTTPVAGVTLMHAHFVEHSFERHSHETFSIGVTRSGVQAFRCRGERLLSVSGNIVAFNPDESHDGQRGGDDAFEYSILYVDQSVIQAWLNGADDFSGLRHFNRAVIRDDACSLALTEAISALQQSRESLRAHTLTSEAILELLRRHGDARTLAVSRVGVPAWIGRVRDYIDAHFIQDITVDDLARLLEVSRVHLTRAFTAAYSVPPHIYLNSVRLRHAKTRLLQGWSVVQVAAECGFADQSHFSKRFKGSVGMTPVAWTREMLGRTGSRLSTSVAHSMNAPD